MPEPVSGQQANDNVTMTKAEHDELQGRLRKADSAEKDRKTKAAKAKAEADKKATDERLKAAQDAGIGKELRDAEAARDESEAKLKKVLTDNAIRDAAGTREWSKSAQRAAVQMVDSSLLERDDDGAPTADSLTTALDGLATEYPDIYVSTGQTGDGEKGGKKKAVHTPANPGTGNQKAHFDGFITPQEFMDTPFEARQTQDFRTRLDRSRQYWDTEFNHKELG
jgi:hypothetical protein